MQIYNNFLVAFDPDTGVPLSVCIDITGEENKTFPFRKKWYWCDIEEVTYNNVRELMRRF